MDVRIVDTSGAVLVDEQVTSSDNGFVGFWLPRDAEGTLEVTHDGTSGTRTFSTSTEDPTCVTTPPAHLTPRVHIPRRRPAAP